MKIVSYKKENDFSYALGATLVFELIKKHYKDTIEVLVHSSIKKDLLFEIEKMCNEKNIIIEKNDKAFNILSQKENCFVIGVFKKFETKLSLDAPHVVLVNPSNTGNVGTIIRSSVGFGVKDIAIIDPSADKFDPKTVRASMGSIFTANIQNFSSFESYSSIYKRNYYPFMLKAKTMLQKVKNIKTPFSLIFGNEASGLPDLFLNVGEPIIINHSKDIDSLNIQTAVSIALYEFTK